MNRYITFLDILGFADLVKTKSLAEVKQRMGTAMVSIQLAKAGGVHAGVPALNVKPPYIFSFSDTFVVASQDTSAEAVASYVVTSALLTQYLFAQCLPVRGAMTFGEADYIEGTQHLIGKGIVTAAEWEKKQDWMGVLVDLPSIPPEGRPVFELPVIAPMFTHWDVPLKEGKILSGALVVNWRFNLYVEGGTKSLFSKPPGDAEKIKLDHTLTFAKQMVTGGKAYGKVTDEEGKPVPWLNGCNVRSLAWAHRPERVHGDDH